MEPTRELPNVMPVDDATQPAGASSLRTMLAPAKELPGSEDCRDWHMPRAPLMEALKRFAREISSAGNNQTAQSKPARVIAIRRR
jgi:hypothetical protein